MSNELYDVEFRKQVIRLLLQDVEFSNRFLYLLEKQYFKEYSLQIIFDAIQNLRYKNEDLKEINKTELKVEVYDICSINGIPAEEIEEDINTIYSLSNVNVDLIKEKLVNWIRKERVIEALKLSIDKVKTGDIDDIRSIIEKAFDINIGEDYGFVFEEDYEEFISLYRNKYSEGFLIKTGFKEYDEALMGGYGAGEVHTIVSPPKLGKSTIATNIGLNVLKQGYAVIHITLELSEIDVMSKYYCLMTGLSYRDLLKEEENNILQRVNIFYSAYKPELFVKFYPNKTITTENIKSYIVSLRSDKKIKKKIGLIIVDYDDLLLPTTGAKEQYDASGDIYFDLVKLANYFECPVLTLSQPRREAWSKAYAGELITGQDISHSAKKIHNTYSMATLNKTNKNTNSYILYVDLARRGKSGVQVVLEADLERAKFRSIES